MLTTEQRDRFQRDGYIVIPNFKSADEIARLRARAGDIVDSFDPAESRAIFTTRDQAKASDAWFLGSDNTIRCFFEEEAFGPDGRLKQPKALSINKIGHAMHDLDPVFSSFSRSADLAELAGQLSLRNPVLLQSMYIFKQPHIGGEVTLHCDHTFLWTDPGSVVGFWFALEDATLENGCLWAVPGGHHQPVRQRFRRAPDGGTTFDALVDTPYPLDGEAPLEVSKGTLIVLHGTLPHRSGPNHSDHSRHAYSLHTIDASAAYPSDNWLQRSPSLPLRGFE